MERSKNNKIGSFNREDYYLKVSLLRWYDFEVLIFSCYLVWLIVNYLEVLGIILLCVKKESSRDFWEIELNKRCFSFYVLIYDKIEEVEVDRSKEYIKLIWTRNEEEKKLEERRVWNEVAFILF